METAVDDLVRALRLEGPLCREAADMIASMSAVSASKTKRIRDLERALRNAEAALANAANALKLQASTLGDESHAAYRALDN